MSTGPENLEYKNETLSLRLQEAEQALNAIRNGEVDAIIVSAENRPKIYTLESPDLPYRQIVETMNAGTVTLNRAGTVLYANGVFADMLKRRMETVIGAKFSNFVSPAHRGRLASFLKDPANHSDEMALVTESGEEVFVQLSGSIQAIGGLPRTCLVATDISRRVSAENALRKAHDELEEKVAQRTAELLWTNDLLRGEIEERKRAEEALRRSRGKLEQRVRERTKILQRQASLLDLAHNAILVRDMENRITFWNRGAEEMYGFTKEEALGKAPDMLLKTEFPAPLADLMREVNKEERWEGELIHTTKNGHRITVLSRWALQRDDAGTPSAVMEINLDITKGKQAERALQSAYVYNRSLIEAGPDPLVTITTEGKIGDVNAATESITGRARGELIGTDFSDYFTDPEEARAGYRRVFDKGYVRDYPLEIKRKDGHVTQVLYNASVYRDDAGNVLGVFAAARDITDQIQMEEQLRQTHKLEAVGTLAGGIAHDFNNMLAVIIGNAELALDGVIDEATRRNITQILGASKRSRDLIKQILTFTRKDSGKGKSAAIAPVLRDVYELLRGSLPSTIDIELEGTGHGRGHGRGRAFPDRAGRRQPGEQRGSCHEGERREAVDPPFDGERPQFPLLRRRQAWEVRKTNRQGHGHGHHPTGAGADVRSFLHDKGTGRRDRYGACRRLRHR